MAPEEHTQDHIEEQEVDGDDEGFLDPNDVVIEYVDDGDHPMDDDDFDVDGDMEFEGEGAGGDQPGDSVVYQDNSIQHFPAHTGSVFAVSTHPSAPLAVSGGQDDLGYIWDYMSGEQIVKLTGHTDSVSATGFSFDGELVSTGGMDGKVRIWRRVGKENWLRWEFLTELQGPDEVVVCSDFDLHPTLMGSVKS